MKKLLFLILLLPSISLAKTITLVIPDDEIKIVENDVIDAEQWIKDAWRGKVNKCKGRLVDSEIKLSVDAGEALPAGESAIIQKHFLRPGYKNRKERDKELSLTEPK